MCSSDLTKEGLEKQLKQIEEMVEELLKESEKIDKLEEGQTVKLTEELPILVGSSRKSMITKLLDIPTTEALNGTTVANTIALMKGADIIRVHDVKDAVQAVKIVQKCRNL